MCRIETSSDSRPNKPTIDEESSSIGCSRYRNWNTRCGLASYFWTILSVPYLPIYLSCIYLSISISLQFDSNPSPWRSYHFIIHQGGEFEGKNSRRNWYRISFTQWIGKITWGDSKRRERIWKGKYSLSFSFGILIWFLLFIWNVSTFCLRIDMYYRELHSV